MVDLRNCRNCTSTRNLQGMALWQDTFVHMHGLWDGEVRMRRHWLGEELLTGLTGSVEPKHCATAEVLSCQKGGGAYLLIRQFRPGKFQNFCAENAGLLQTQV